MITKFEILQSTESRKIPNKALLGVNSSFTRFTTFQVNYLFGFFVLVCSSFLDF